MKKQINPTIKAQILRSAFYLLLLLAVCAIPFALAERNAIKQRAAKPALTSSAPSGINISRDASQLLPYDGPRKIAGPPAASGVVQTQPAQARSVLAWAATRQDRLRQAFVATMAHEKVGPIE